MNADRFGADILGAAALGQKSWCRRRGSNPHDPADRWSSLRRTCGPPSSTASSAPHNRRESRDVLTGLVLPLVSKQLQVDGIRQCLVSQVVWVPVVSAVVESTDLGRGS